MGLLVVMVGRRLVSSLVSHAVSDSDCRLYCSLAVVETFRNVYQLHVVAWNWIVFGRCVLAADYIDARLANII